MQSSRDEFAGTNGTGSHIDNPLSRSQGLNGSMQHANGVQNHQDQHVPTTQAELLEPIAICGMALRLPSGLKTPQQFWEFLLSRKDGRTRVPDSRYNIASFYDPSGKPTGLPTEYGYFLDEDLGAIDTSFFSLSRTELEQTSPEQRLMLEVARECFEEAGETRWRGKNIGCYMGSFGEDWAEMIGRDNQAYGSYRLQGVADFTLSNRISYEMDLRGPSTTTRTACSASLTALHEASLAVSRGDCQAALVGGTNLIMTPTLTSSLADQGVLAKDGCCKTFSADANGYARGEAIVAVLIKKLSDATRDENPIRAVIRGTAINSDGKTPSFSQPSSDAHEALMKRAYEVAGITDYSETALVECHGTGTPTGDPIETRAVARVFGEKGVYITSVKPNLGHAEGASGLVSVIKSVLALENRTIAPNIHMREPNPNIPFREGKLTVPLEPTLWPQDRHERASISSFGAGGANAHVIVDSAASFGIKKRPTPPSNTHHLLLFSANTQESLTRLVEEYQKHVGNAPERIEDIAYTLANRREQLRFKAFAIAHNGNIGVPVLSSSKSVSPPSLIMVFTGQGAQWPLMARDLLRSNSTFRDTIRSLDGCLARLAEHTPDWTIEEELCKVGKKSRVHTAEFAQPLCTAIQIALVDCFRELGIRPHAVVGHSSGEIAAAYAAGSLNAQEAITTAFYRGVIGRLSGRKGAMAAISMGWDEIKLHLPAGIDIACDNSPKSVTISGDVEKVESMITDLRKSHPDVLSRKLQVDKAYHSHHVLEWSQTYEAFLKSTVVGNPATLPFFSSVSGNLFQTSASPGPWYWRQNMESPVLFRSAVSNILSHDIGKNPIFVEIGPHSALSGPLRQILSHASRSAPYMKAMARGQNTVESLLSAVGSLYINHIPIRLEALYSNGKCLPDLPRYPWHHDESFWAESRLSRDFRHRKHGHHDLLGVRTLESAPTEPSWRNLLHLNTVSWVRDHTIIEDVVFPMAGYLAIAGEAVRQTSGIDEAFTIKRFVMVTALVIREGKPTEIITNLKRNYLTDVQESGWWEFTISSYNGSVWKKHCVGLVRAHAEPPRDVVAEPDFPRKIDQKSFYHSLSGVFLGPSFQNLRDITADTRQQRTSAVILNGQHPDAHKYYLHPCVIDSIIQLGVYNEHHGYTRDNKTWLPVGVEEFTMYRCTKNFSVHCRLTLKDGFLPINEAWASVNGRMVAKLAGLKFALDHDLNTIGAVDNHAAAMLEWGSDINFLQPTPNAPISTADQGQERGAARVYGFSEYVRSLAHSKPNLRVLEVGATESSPCKQVLDYLTRANGQFLCSQYAFASTQPSNNASADVKTENITHLTLDLSEDISQQGYSGERYDLIIAIGILRNSASSNIGLSNARTLLRPKGHLIIQEIDGVRIEDANWSDALQSAGYENFAGTVLYQSVSSDPDTLLLCHEPRFESTATDISLLCRDPASIPPSLLYKLQQAGYLVTLCTLQDSIPQSQDVVAVLDEGGPFIDSIGPSNFDELKGFLHRLKDSGILWITQHSQTHVSDPRYAQIIGFARTIRSELLLDFATCEVGDLDAVAGSVVKVFSKFTNRRTEESLAPDFEYVIHDNIISVGRFFPFNLKDDLVSEESIERAVLEVGVPGRLNTMKWVGRSGISDLRDNEVEIELFAVGLSFRDILIALKIIEIVPSFFGWEGAGIVKRVGSQVHNVQPGDRVAAIGPDMLATSVTLDASCVVKIPDILGFDEASAMFFPYLTALYSLQNVGGLEKGQTVLIHSACGGVGLAALEVARMLGAHIYVTVGSDTKVQYLIDTYGIPRSHIFNSRDISFEEDIRRETKGTGVDLVLNSLAGDLLHASWRCVAQFGRLIELGKRDLIGNANLNMNGFLGNRTYTSVDVGFLPFVRKPLLARIMKSIVELYEQGKLPALQPVKVFNADAAQEAFRFMQPGQHIGRICLSLQKSCHTSLGPTITPGPKTLTLDPNSSYLLAGGLGGIGRSISKWMVEIGARHLIYISRTAGNGPEDRSLETELNSMECSVQFCSGDITRVADVERAISRAAKPLKGILQLSAVFRDENFEKMTIEQWHEALAPKVQGTWNLHNASSDLDLDFFVLFSSLSGIIGQPGQANYSSANTFLDAFVQYRHGLGLTASSIDIGAMVGIGHISDSPGLLEKMSGAGFKTLRESSLLDALVVVMQPNRRFVRQYRNAGLADPYTFVLGLSSGLPLKDPANRTIWKNDRRMAFYHNTDGASTVLPATTSSLTAYIANARTNTSVLKTPASHAFFALEIGKRVFELLLKPEDDLDTSLSFGELGVDSLLGIELKQWWRQVFGFDISVLELLGTGNLDALGKFAAEGLLKEVSN